MLQYIRNSTQMGQCYKPRQVKVQHMCDSRLVVGYEKGDAPHVYAL